MTAPWDRPEAEYDFTPSGITNSVASFISLCGCIYVIFTYWTFPLLQKHPASLMLWMAIFALGFNIIFSVEFYTKNSSLSCKETAPISHFFLIGQEFYFMMIAADLLLTIRNPFMVEKRQILVYHFLVWFFSGTSALMLRLSKQSGVSAFGFCWMESYSQSDDHLFSYWAYPLLLIPMLTIYCFLIVVYVIVERRLQTGLPECWDVRQHAMRVLRAYVVVFMVFWTVAAVAYFCLQASTRLNCPIVRSFFRFIIGSKGILNALLWTYTQRVDRMFGMWKKGNWDEAAKRSGTVNWALRREIVYYARKGIYTSIKSPIKKKHQRVRRFFLPGVNHSNDGVDFTEYEPILFSTLRRTFGIQTAAYMSSMKINMKEKFSEGKSGAFFYFTANESFLIKTCTKEEHNYMLRILPKYVDYVKVNPGTYLCRYAGCYELILYGKSVRFIVMQSVFDTSSSIDQCYDLKGSKLGRRSKTSFSELSVCKHCQTSFVIGKSKEICLANLSKQGHEAEYYGKDLDWGSRRLDLDPTTASELRMQLKCDSFFLATIDSLDYSLLVGIHMGGLTSEDSTLQSKCGSGRFGRCSRISLNSSNYPKSKEVSEDKSLSSSSEWFSCASQDSVCTFLDSNNLSDDDEKDLPQALPCGDPHNFHELYVVYLGIVDILTPWSARKQLEHWFRVYILFQKFSDISCIPPQPYAKRFQENVADKLTFDDTCLEREKNYPQHIKNHCLSVEPTPSSGEAAHASLTYFTTMRSPTT